MNDTLASNVCASLSRRNFISIAAAGAAASLPAVALAEATGKTSRLLQPPELPIDRIERCANELAEILNEYQHGRFYACVYPSADYDAPVILRSIAAERRFLTLEEQFDYCISNLKTILAKMRPDASTKHRLLLCKIGEVPA